MLTRNGTAAASGRLWMRIAREALRDPLRLAGAALSLVGLGATQLALPWVIKEWVQGPVARGGVPVTQHVLVALVIVTMLAVFIAASWSLLVSVDQRLVARLRSAAVSRVLHLEPGVIERFPTGDLMSRILHDAALLSGVTDAVMRRTLGDGFLLVGAITMMFLLHWQLALAACVLGALVVSALAAYGRVIRSLGTAAQQQMAALSTILQEQLRGFSTIKGYRTEDFEATRFDEGNRSYRATSVRAGTWSAAVIGAAFLVAATGFVVAVWLGSHQVSTGRLSAGGLLAFCLYAGLAVEPMRRLAETQSMLQRTLPAAGRLFELLELPLPSDQPRPPTLAAALAGTSVRAPRHLPRGISLSFQDVHFRHLPNQPLLNGICLDVSPGERIAVVAASGGGKSTLASLLLRFRDPDAGRILIDGVDSRRFPLSELRQLVCVVEQTPFLFGTSIYDNLRYGTWGAGDEAIRLAASLCGLEPLSDRHQLGIHANLRETGSDLSAGQRQRVALARAILKNPPLLVLDEATSALDSQAESEVFARIEPWLEQRTVILMAHRLSTVRRCSRIVVLEGGRVAADGVLGSLERHAPSFAALFADQLELAADEAV